MEEKGFLGRERGLNFELRTLNFEPPNGEFWRFEVRSSPAAGPLEFLPLTGLAAPGTTALYRVSTITATGNEMGLDAAALAALPAAERSRRLEDAGARLRAGGADDVIGSVAELPAWLERRGAV